LSHAVLPDRHLVVASTVAPDGGSVNYLSDCQTIVACAQYAM
jgi:hypothetical protein